MKSHRLLYLLAILVMLGLAACATPPETAAPPAAENVISETGADPAAEPVVAESAVENTAVIAATAAETTGDAVEAAASAVAEEYLGVPDPIQLNLAAAAELTDDEIASLFFMREEEKLAHDVYIAFHEMWRLPVFENIARSEQNHINSLLRLLEKYGLSDPAQDNPAGVFNDATLQTMYHDLVNQGSQSLLDALYAAAAIEEIDILDLQADLALTDKADIQTTYQNLIAGSENHLRAFAQMIQRQTGEPYAPQYLSADYYAEIMAGNVGRNRLGQAGGGMGVGQAGGGNGYRGDGAGNLGQP
jgi:hypothetical protein